MTELKIIGNTANNRKDFKMRFRDPKAHLLGLEAAHTSGFSKDDIGFVNAYLSAGENYLKNLVFEEQANNLKPLTEDEVIDLAKRQGEEQ